MDAAEFDVFAEEYLATHQKNLKISGEAPDYFARYKLDELRRLWTQKRYPEPQAVLDFGCGIGASLPQLARVFPGSKLTGLDVSKRSLEIAGRLHPGVADLVQYDGDTPPFGEASFDLIFSACVFHHIDHAEHAKILTSLKRLLRPGGRLAIFEHNPINPVTRYIVATCPFDRNARLLEANTFARAQVLAGFSKVETRFTGVFPGPLKALRPLEPALARLPIGAQYYTLAHV
jgi:SAM-dependent methyltransferase